MSVFKWEQRKGWDVLLGAYFREFKRSEGVVLRLRSYKPSWEPGPDQVEEWVRLFARQQMQSPLDKLPRVVVLGELSRERLAEAYSAADAFVLPSRGDGLCLPCMEAMATGLPSIITNYSGPASFLTDQNSLPIRVAKVYANRQAEPDPQHLREHMRRVANDRSLAASLGRQARADIIDRFSAQRVSEEVLRLLEAAATKDQQPRNSWLAPGSEW